MRKLIASILCLVLAMSHTLAQTCAVRGKVSGVQGNPVPNASVLVKGATSGVSTNADGAFSIPVANTAKALIVRSVGFAEQEYTIYIPNVLENGL